MPDADAADELLRRRTVAPGDVVLVKASRDAGLRWLGDRLRRRGDLPTARTATPMKAILLAAVVSPC